MGDLRKLVLRVAPAYLTPHLGSLENRDSRVRTTVESQEPPEGVQVDPMVADPDVGEVVLLVGCECVRSKPHGDDPAPCPKCDGRRFTEARFGSLAEMQDFAASLRPAPPR